VVAYKLFRGSVSYYHSFEKYSDAPTLFGAFSLFEPGFGWIKRIKKKIFMSELKYKLTYQDFAGILLTPVLEDIKFECFKRPEVVACSFPLNQKNPPKSRFR